MEQPINEVIMGERKTLQRLSAILKEEVDVLEKVKKFIEGDTPKFHEVFEMYQQRKRNFKKVISSLKERDLNSEEYKDAVKKAKLMHTYFIGIVNRFVTDEELKKLTAMDPEFKSGLETLDSYMIALDNLKNKLKEEKKFHEDIKFLSNELKRETKREMEIAGKAKENLQKFASLMKLMTSTFTNYVNLIDSLEKEHLEDKAYSEKVISFFNDVMKLENENMPMIEQMFGFEETLVIRTIEAVKKALGIADYEDTVVKKYFKFIENEMLELLRDRADTFNDLMSR